MRLDCLHFTGYKPCGKSLRCDDDCNSYQSVTTNILFIHLGALGAVVRSTALLAAIRRKYPNASLTWVTSAPADALLKFNPMIDRVLTTRAEDLLSLHALQFDVVLNIDKSLAACGLMNQISACEKYGFVSDKNGKIIPATDAANELWKIGLSNQVKFYENCKTELQLSHEALGLGPYLRDDYFLPLTNHEQQQVRQRKQAMRNHSATMIGINTGCANTIKEKKMDVTVLREVIAKIHQRNLGQVVLLGGPEDTERNFEIAKDLDVVCSSTTSGLRDGLISVACCDVILTGDSLGMHMAISQKIPVVAWFGPTCAHEIDLFDRGIAIESPMTCAPCWKRDCSLQLKCNQTVDVESLISSLEKFSCRAKPAIIEQDL